MVSGYETNAIRLFQWLPAPTVAFIWSFIVFGDVVIDILLACLMQQKTAYISIHFI